MNNSTLKKLTDLRKELHQHPEVSGKETKTAERIKGFLNETNPSLTIEKVGGEGLLFVYDSQIEGPCSMYRCELDGLPIKEENSIPHKSKIKGQSHVCGHDGHMAIISGLGLHLAENPPEKGKVCLLFQPAEEIGTGAQAVAEDPKYIKIKPDYAFALHNLPGYDMHQVVIKKAAFAAASTGMIIKIKGRNSHSAHPEAGNSPVEAMSKIMVALQKLPDAMKKFCLVTVIHARVGDVAFGTTPGEATVCATLRAYEDATLEKLLMYAEKLVSQIVKEYKLEVSFDYVEKFAATHNHPEAWEIGKSAAKKSKLKAKNIRIPFRWSEDFGSFSNKTKTLLFGLGSGKKQPQLHEPNFDFPDELIPTGVNMFAEIVGQLHR